MKAFLTAVSVLSFTSANMLHAFDDEVSVETVSANHLFVPGGFDNNDEVEVMLDGFFPSGCYKLTDASFVKSESFNAESGKKFTTIKITPKARYFKNKACVQMLVPYTQSVKLGLLEAGDYEISVADSSIVKKLTVKESSNDGPDNLIYAPVEGVHVGLDQASERYVATLTVHLTSTCMSFQGIHHEQNGDTIVLLPRVRTEDRWDCKNEDRYLSGIKYQLPKLDKGRYLLHVRSFNGRAVNEVYSVE